MLVLYKKEKTKERRSMFSWVLLWRDIWWGPCLILYVAFRVRRCFYFGIIILTIKNTATKNVTKLSKYICTYIYFILYNRVDVEMCDVPLWNLFKSKVRFKKKIVYKCMFLMCSILTNKNKEMLRKIWMTVLGVLDFSCIFLCPRLFMIFNNLLRYRKINHKFI